MKRSKKFEASSSKTSTTGKQIIISSAIGSAIGVGVFLIFALVSCAICMGLSRPLSLVAPFCFFCVYAASFTSGFAAVKINRGSDALLCGSLCGAMLMLLCWGVFSLLGVFFSVTDASALSIIWKLLIIPCSVMGGFLGLGQSGKKTKHKF